MSDNTVYGHALNRVLIDDNTLITLQNSYLLEIQSRGYFDGFEPGTDEYEQRVMQAIELFKIRLAEQYKAEGTHYLKEKRNQVAVELYEAAVYFHKTPVNYSNLAAALFNTKEFMKSASASATALQLDPNFTKGYVRFGRALAALKQYTAAIEEYDKALQLEPNQPIVIKYRQEALEKKQQSV